MTPQKAANLAHRLFQTYSLDGWTFKLNRARTYYGICHLAHNRIELSKYFIEIESDRNIKVVLLHEIAHALTPEDGGHGKKWKEKCVELGIEPIMRLKLKPLPALYNASCILCGAEYRKNRRAAKKLYCKFCGCKKELKWIREVASAQV